MEVTPIENKKVVFVLPQEKEDGSTFTLQGRKLKVLDKIVIYKKDYLPSNLFLFILGAEVTRAIWDKYPNSSYFTAYVCDYFEEEKLPELL